METWENCTQKRLLYKTVLWEPLKKVYTHHRDIIATDVTHFNNIVQVQIHKDTDLDTGYILMRDLFSDFTLDITVTDTGPQMVSNNFFTHWVQGQCGNGFGLPTNYIHKYRSAIKHNWRQTTMWKVRSNLEIPKCIHSYITHTRHGTNFLDLVFEGKHSKTLQWKHCYPQGVRVFVAPYQSSLLLCTFVYIKRFRTLAQHHRYKRSNAALLYIQLTWDFLRKSTGIIYNSFS